MKINTSVPENNKLKKAKFSKLNDEEKSSLKGKSCALAISVGQDYHEKETLKATVELINESKFDNCTIVIADILQRHTIKIIYNNIEKEAIDLAKINGVNWLKRNYILGYMV